MFHRLQQSPNLRRLTALSAVSALSAGSLVTCVAEETRSPSSQAVHRVNRVNTHIGHSFSSSTNCAAAEPVDAAHEILDEYTLPDGVRGRDHVFRVPLDHHNAEGSNKTIKVFVRELVSDNNKDTANLPYLLYLQGGPGFPSARPSVPAGGWIGQALSQFRVLLLDQRGTGRSTPMTAQTLARKGSAEEQAAYLAHFRADAIVEDCEVIRRTICCSDQNTDTKVSLLGQSFGGFCLLTYLSNHPESIECAMFTFGLAPVLRSADEVYRAAYRSVIKRNMRYYHHYPQDVSKVRRVVRHLLDNDVRLPDGARLTARRFLQLGLGRLGSYSYSVTSPHLTSSRLLSQA